MSKQINLQIVYQCSRYMKKMKTSDVSYLMLLMCLNKIKCNLDHHNSLSRSKRYLLFPSGTNVIQLIIGVGIPVEVTPEAIIFGWAVRAVYAMPDNISDLMWMDYGSSRKKRHVSRWDIYKMLEYEATARGHEGRACVLRSICKAADTPLDRDHGLFEELVHAVFTPTSTNEIVEQHTDNQYFAAQYLGLKYKGKCQQFFPECEASLIDMFTHSSYDDDVIT